MKSPIVPFSAFALFALSVAEVLPAQTPVGDEFQVNSYTTGDQNRPFATHLPNDDFLVVWESAGSAGSDGSGDSVQARHFQLDGTATGDDFQVNTTTAEGQFKASAAVDGEGEFTVVWINEQAYGGWAIRARHFDPSIVATGDDFQVNSSFQNTYLGTGYRSIASSRESGFVVVWDASNFYTTVSTIHGRLFDREGVPVSSDLDLVDSNENKQFLGSVAADPEGRFLLVWSEFKDYYRGIFGQAYEADGSPAGSAFPIAKRTHPPERRPDVHGNAKGAFVTVWQSSDGVHARRYNAEGQAQGLEIRVSSKTDRSGQTFPRVATLPDGSFVVVWQTKASVGTDTDGSSIQGRFFAPDGTPSGNDFQINTYTAGDQDRPAVSASRSTGEFVVVWASDGSSGNDNQEQSIQAQSFSASLAFLDDFESGDTSAWSSTVE